METQRLLKVLASLTLKTRELERFVQSVSGWERLPGLSHAIQALRSEIAENYKHPDKLNLDRVERLRIIIQEIRNYASTPTFAGTSRRAEGAAGVITAGQILDSRCESLNNNTLGLEIGVSRLSMRDIVEIVPNQKVAAFQFGYLENRIVIRPQRSETAPGDKDIALSAKTVLLDEGRILLEDLRGSNCAPRLIAAFTSLQTKIESGDDIIQVGMLKRTADAALRASSDELATTLAAMLSAHLTNISHYLAQFPEWQRFSLNVSNVRLSEIDVANLRSTAAALSSYLKNRPELADADVPEALDTVCAWAAEEAQKDGRSALALARTLENLWSLIVRGFIAVKDEIIKEGRKKIAMGIFAFVGASYSAFAPSMAQVPGAEWIQATFDYLKSLLL